MRIPAFGWPLYLVAAVSLIPAAARADAVADFYHGKEVRLIISSSVGGGYDTYARAVAKHLGEHIPGNPTIVPQNMPAAGGLGAANHVYNLAAKDGTVLGALQNTVPFEPFFYNKQAQFDATKFNWLGTPTTEVGLYLVWHGSKVQSLKDAQSMEFMAGGAGAPPPPPPPSPPPHPQLSPKSGRPPPKPRAPHALPCGGAREG